jgi:hypothetical protein
MYAYYMRWNCLMDCALVDATPLNESVVRILSDDLGFLASVAARHEDVVQALLLTPSLLLFIDVTLLIRHICQRFAISVGLLVDLDLPIALLLKHEKILEERYSSLSSRLHLPQKHVQMAGRNRLRHFSFSHFMRLRDLRVQLFYLAEYMSHF